MSPRESADVHAIAMTDNPHDHLVRATFVHPPQAAAELRSVLPPVLVAQLDFTTLAAVSGTFIDATLRDREADLLFTVQVRGGGERLVYVLFEHQSTIDPWLPLRLLEYQLQIWERWRGDHPAAKKLPPIVPVVLYHGDRPWTGSPCFGDLLDGSSAEDGDDANGGTQAKAALRECCVDFRFILDDLTRCSDEDLFARALDAISLLTLLGLKHARTDEDLCPRLLSWTWVMDDAARCPGGPEAVKRFFRYLAMVSKRVSRAFVKEELMPRLDDESAREAGLTLAEQWIEEGREKGLKQGIEQGIEQGLEQGRRDLLHRLLEERFGALPPSAIEQVAAASSGQLDRWAVRLFHAQSLEEALAV